jgi:membrane protein implicated in regulation of membrane protease activity
MPEFLLIALGIAGFLFVIVVLPVVLQNVVFAGMTSLLSLLFGRREKQEDKTKQGGDDTSS